MRTFPRIIASLFLVLLSPLLILSASSVNAFDFDLFSSEESKQTVSSASVSSLVGQIGVRNDVTVTSYTAQNRPGCTNCFSIQQNLYLYQPSNPDAPKYLFQNTIGIQNGAFPGQYFADRQFVQWDYAKRTKLSQDPTVPYNNEISLKRTFSLSASVSEGSLVLVNDFGSHSYSVETGSVLGESWNLAIVGFGERSNAEFKPGTLGSVRTQILLTGMGSHWLSASDGLHQEPTTDAGGTAESSSNLEWLKQSDGSYTFSYVYGAHVEGLAFNIESPGLKIKQPPQYPSSSFVGETTIRIDISNPAGLGPTLWSTIAISFPQVTDASDIISKETDLQCSGTGADSNCAFPKDFHAGAEYGKSTRPLNYVLVEVAKSAWMPGESHYLSVKVRLRAAGDFHFYVKSVSAPYGSNLKGIAQGTYSDPPSSVGLGLECQLYPNPEITPTCQDQQSESVYHYKITVGNPAQALTTGVASGQGSVSPSYPNGFQQQVGSQVSVTATPEPGWSLSSSLWTVSGAQCSGGQSSNPCTFTMPSNPVSVYANFVQGTRILYARTFSGEGSVDPSCPNGCQRQVSSQVSVSANPSQGWSFTSWKVYGAQCSADASISPCTFTMPDGDVIVLATFNSIAFSISTPSSQTTSQGGSVTFSFTVTMTSGTPQSVTLSVLNPPPGIGAPSWTRNPLTPSTTGTNVQLTITTSCSTPAQSYNNLQIIGQGGGTSAQSSTFSLTVSPSSSCQGTLSVAPVSPSNGATVSSSPAAFQVLVSSGGAISDATVVVYLDGGQVCSGNSDPNGYFSCSYALTQIGHTYIWYATASKSGYNPGTSEQWSFSYTCTTTTVPPWGVTVSTDKGVYGPSDVVQITGSVDGGPTCYCPCGATCTCTFIDNIIVQLEIMNGLRTVYAKTLTLYPLPPIRPYGDSFSLSGLESGDYQVIAHASYSGYPAVEARSSFRLGGTATTTVRWGEIRGIVLGVDSFGNSATLAQAVVEATGRQAFATTTGSDGTFALVLPVDNYIVTASAVGYDPQSASITIAEGSWSIEFLLTPSVTTSSVTTSTSMTTTTLTSAVFSTTYAGTAVITSYTTSIVFTSPVTSPIFYTTAFQISSNSTISGFQFDSARLSLRFTTSGPEGTTGFTRVIIAKSLVDGAPTVSIDDGNTLITSLTISSNSTHYSLSFTYPQSVHIVVVGGSNTVPEFRHEMLLMVSIIVFTLCATYVRNRKKALEMLSANRHAARLRVGEIASQSYRDHEQSPPTYSSGDDHGRSGG